MKLHLFILMLCLLSFNLYAQEINISGILQWERMEFNAIITLNLQKAGIKLPAGRSQAEALLEDELPELMRPFINEIQADSSSTIADLINRGELSHTTFLEKVHSMPPALTPDLSSIFARYSVNLISLGADLIRHSRPQRISPPLIPAHVRDYTGIIIIADENLPVRGKSSSAFLLPCLFPKIWDSEMNLIFERNMIDPQIGRSKGLVRYISRESIYRAVPSAMDEELVKLVGDNPLRIYARGVFGAVPTDPVIDREDALLILSTENNRRLLLEGRIAIVLDKKELSKTVP
ncbi:MAG: polymerase [Treponema sp.]|nr:polymerase [Treponema sp.]